MSKEGPFEDFDPISGGRYHIHDTGANGDELHAYLSQGVGFLDISGVIFRISDYCRDGVHSHPDGQSVKGGNVLLKPIS